MKRLLAYLRNLWYPPQRERRGVRGVVMQGELLLDEYEDAEILHALRQDA